MHSGNSLLRSTRNRAKRVQSKKGSLRSVKSEARAHFVLCINNVGNPASLETLKVYRTLPDAKAKALKLLRIIDESGEDYLYPADQFVAVQLPASAQRAVLARS